MYVTIPTLQTIRKYFDLDTAKRLHTAMRETAGMSSYAAVDAVMDKCNEILGHCGVEATYDNGWSVYYCDIGLLYTNSGDTYDPCVMFDTRDWRFRVDTWGDYVSRRPKRFE